jgi:hypothetical protein
MTARLFGWIPVILAASSGVMLLVTGSLTPLSITAAALILPAAFLCGWFF